jgi:ATP-binding cassette subfamily B protein
LLFSLAVQPLMNERDLRVRSHFGAMQGFYLDALRGSVPVRIHSAERSVRRGHEALLVQWARAALRQLQLALWVEGQRSLLCLALAGWLLYSHIQAIGISGNLLLLSYWVLKLPTLGERLAALSLQYPSLRNIAMRALEPINSFTGTVDVSSTPVSGNTVADAQTIDDLTIKSPGAGISLRNAHLKVAGHDILENINLDVDGGEHIAIVGPSGAGKSSMLGLLLGWYQLAAGELHVDGNAVDANALQQLRRETAWVDPAIQLWNRSLLENLRYNPSALPSAEWIRIIEQADLNSVLAHLPDGLQGNLGEGGARLSGGEGQRVRLARALGQRAPRLVLLDEPFRGLDRAQRALHLQQCRRHWQHSTLLCVIHDIEETASFDRVWVIDGGRLVEDGTPTALAADPASRYSQLLASERKLTTDLWGAPVWRRLHLEQGQVHQSNPFGAEVCSADVA